MSLFETLQQTADAIRRLTKVNEKPEVGIVLGSGLGGLADRLENKSVVPYAEIPNFPNASVPGHAGQLVLGTLHGRRVVAMQGRVHAYEGHAPGQVVFPVRTLCALGIHTLVVTNAAGGIRPEFKPGDLMSITDHINLSGWSPLTGPNDSRLGPRFPDMSHAYTPKLLALLDDSARQTGVALHRGVYAHMFGPTYETPAEVRMLRVLGGDAVGMSTVPEVIAAAHMGVRVAGVSCITNHAAGIGDKPLTHEDVAAVAREAESRFTRLMLHFLPLAANVS